MNETPELVLNRLWLVHRPTNMRVLLATQTPVKGGKIWHFRSDNEVQREFDQLSGEVAAHARANHFTDADFALELLDAEHSPFCFGINRTTPRY